MLITLIYGIILFFLLNAIVYFLYTRGKTTHSYDAPKFEFENKTLKPSFENIFIWPIIVDMWVCRPKHKVIMGGFNLPDVAIHITVYRDMVTGLYSFGTNKRMRHRVEYNEVIHSINYLFDNVPAVRLKYVRLVQLLEHYTPENFGGSGVILSDHILNSSTPITVFDNVP